MRNTFGRSVIMPEIPLKNMNISNHMPPKCKHYIQTDGTKIHYWNKRIDKLVNLFMENIMTNKTFDMLQKIDPVIGGDHGQGAFCGTVKIIQRTSSRKII